MICRMSIQTIKEYNPYRESNVLIIVFDDMIVDMIIERKFDEIVIELLIRGRKLNISIDFITQSYFAVTNDIEKQCLKRTQQVRHKASLLRMLSEPNN